MSRAATDWAWSLAIKPASLKLLLLSMADRADEYHRCYPSVERLVKDTGLDRKTIIGNIAKLQDAGVLTDTGKRAGRTGKVKIYRLNLVDVSQPISTGDNSPKSGMVPKTESSQKRTGNSPKNGTLNSPKNGTQNQSFNQSMNQERVGVPAKRNSPSDKFIFDKWPAAPSGEVFADWVKARAAAKKPLTQGAVDYVAPELHKAVAAGMSVDDCLRVTLGEGWQGFKFDWAVNRGLVPTSGQAPQHWTSNVFDDGDPLI
ncbi:MULTISPECIES: helix-turn-helix domain-containing protein [Shewanella]|uniref:helix-turn-helix domain-containing protein n=1 Tax=Shewanella TaxID=22 RepID=UPI001430A037|nr:MULTISPECIES: helix-turn-helix domain-containing protein [Shewanella]MBO2684970.1 helix-turn-helix domain-containing protein [Shewanella algae]NJI82858.1 hypothetical protein [Shewanella sp. Iso12]